MQVGRGVGQTRAQVQQGTGRLARHPAITVGRTGTDPFKQAQDRAHPACLANGGHHVHLGSAGVGETDLHTIGGQGLQQAHRSIHCLSIQHSCQTRVYARSSVGEIHQSLA